MLIKLLHFLLLCGTPENISHDCEEPHHISNEMGRHTLVDGVEDIDHDALQAKSGCQQQESRYGKSTGSQELHILLVRPPGPPPPSIVTELGPSASCSRAAGFAKPAHPIRTVPLWESEELAIVCPIATNLTQGTPPPTCQRGSTILQGPPQPILFWGSARQHDIATPRQHSHDRIHGAFHHVLFADDSCNKPFLKCIPNTNQRIPRKCID